MTRGQESLVMELASTDTNLAYNAEQALPGELRKALSILLASEGELAEHQQLLASIQEESKGRCLWLSSKSTA